MRTWKAALNRSVLCCLVAVSLIIGWTAAVHSATKKGDPGPRKGIFVDSPVDGLTYKTPSLSGTTDARGGFKYRSGEDVAFYIGDLKLGSAKGADILTPIQLVPGARNADNATVANICVLLQSLDEDGDLNNGIRINKATTDIVSKYADRIRFDQSIARFVSDVHVAALVADLNAAKVFKSAAAVPRVLQTPQSAKNHLLATLRPRKIVTTTSGAVSGLCSVRRYMGVVRHSLCQDASLAGSPELR